MTPEHMQPAVAESVLDRADGWREVIIPTVCTGALSTCITVSSGVREESTLLTISSGSARPVMTGSMHTRGGRTGLKYWSMGGGGAALPAGVLPRPHDTTRGGKRVNGFCAPTRMFAAVPHDVIDRLKKADSLALYTILKR